MDKQFKAMNGYPGLCHFRKGILYNFYQFVSHASHTSLKLKNSHTHPVSQSRRQIWYQKCQNLKIFLLFSQNNVYFPEISFILITLFVLQCLMLSTQHTAWWNFSADHMSQTNLTNWNLVRLVTHHKRWQIDRNYTVLLISQWTGTEHKEMEKIMLGIAIGGVPNRFITVICSLINFIYLSQLQYHTSTTIKLLEDFLKCFHEHKDIVVELEVCDHFNIPKIHLILHYVKCSSADSYNSESPQRLHIDFTKDAYCASKKRDYSVWLQRYEASWLWESYLIWD